MAQNKAPVVTREEILAVFREDAGTVYTAGQIGWRVWQMRGGTGDMNYQFGVPEDKRVPGVKDYHVKRTVMLMDCEGVLHSIRGSQARTVRTVDYVRDASVYYGLAETIASAKEATARLEQEEREVAEMAAEMTMSLAGRVTTVSAVGSNLVITLTAQQARDLRVCDLLASRYEAGEQ